MVEIPFETDVRCTAETIFDVIVDFRGQDRWLPRSPVFQGTGEISSNPVTLGTTYREPGPLGVRNGRVIEYERPTRLTFHQPMTIRLHLGTIDITMRYLLTPMAGSTHVRRVVTIGVPWPLRLAQPLVVRSLRAENERTLAALKAYADGMG
jgi:uncharacterized protein YndB with AHSA1/START domain